MKSCLREIILNLFFLMLLVAFGYLLYYLSAPSASKRAEEYLGRPLPASADDVRFDETVFSKGFLEPVVDVMVQLRFDSNDRDEVMEWLRDGCEDLRLREDTNPFEDSSGKRWWEPEHDARFPHKGGRCHYSYGWRFSVLIVEMDNGIVRVYFSS